MRTVSLTKAIFLMVTILFVITISGCASRAANQSSNNFQDSNLPSWINEFPPDGSEYLWGIGTAKQSSDSLSMTVAEGRARTSIARQIDSLVQAALIDYLRDAGTVDNQTALALQEDVSRQITDMRLSGVQPDQRWKAPDGAWWYRVQYLKPDVRREAVAIFDSEAARYAEFKANEALRMLDAQLAKNERPLVVQED